MSDLKTSSEQMQKEGYWLRGPDLGYTYGPGMLMLDTEGRDRPPVAMAQWAQAAGVVDEFGAQGGVGRSRRWAMRAGTVRGGHW